jgi:uncharacterized membrane protein
MRPRRRWRHGVSFFLIFLEHFIFLFEARTFYFPDEEDGGVRQGALFFFLTASFVGRNENGSWAGRSEAEAR